MNQQRTSLGLFKKGHIGYKAWLGKTRNLETNKKISGTLKGRPLTEETKNKMSLSRKGKPQLWHRGVPSWNRGLKSTITGEKHWNWQGGISKNRRDDWQHKLWAKEVKKRDDYTCQICEIKGGKLEADHLKSYRNYPDLRYDLNNGRTLCVPCHRRTPNYGLRTITEGGVS